MEQISSDRFPPLSSKYPWLIAQSIQDDEKQDQFVFCTIDNELPHYRCRIPELLGKRIRGFFHGWVILSNHPQNNIWSLWNHVTSKIISLPTLVLEDGEYESIKCCLSAPPVDPTSILLLTTTNKSTFLFCPVDSKREDFRWTEMSYAQQLKRLTSNGKLLDSLTCCNGKVYALSTDGTFSDFVIHLDIVVKYNEVVINLMLFSICPFGPVDSNRTDRDIQYLKGSSTELFYIEMTFWEETEHTENKPSDVYLYKSDMTCINWEERELCFKDWDITNKNLRCDDSSNEDSSSEESNTRSDDLNMSSEIWKTYYIKKMDMSLEVWKVIDDLKDSIFYMDLARDYSVFYSPVVASELGGFIHIRGEMGKTIFSYNVKDNTISLSCIPSPILPTSHVWMWECRLEDDHEEAKCIDDYKEEMENNNHIFLRSGIDNGVEFKNSHLLNIPFDLLEMIMEQSVGVEYMNFRATCKQCLLAAPLIKWSNETSLRRLQTHSPVSPWLMEVDTRRGIITFTDPLLGGNYFVKNSKVLSDENDKLCFSRFGWLLFWKRRLNCLVFFNPFTNDLRELPETEQDLRGLCFSAPPTSLDCMVVGFTEECVYIHYVNQKQTWLGMRLGTDPPPPVCFSGFHYGDVYVSCEREELFIINNIGKKGQCWGPIKAEAPKGCCRSPKEYFITNCDKHNLLVRVSEYGEAVEEQEKVMVLVVDNFTSALEGRGRTKNCMSQRLGANFPERPERSAPVLTPPQTQPLTSYPHNLGNPGNEHEAVTPSADAEFSTLSLTEMQNARGIMDVLAEMLTAVDPEKKDGLKQEVIVDLVEQCRTYKRRVVHLVNSTSDESLLCQGLALNDDLERVLAKHDALLTGTPVPSEKSKPETSQALVPVAPLIDAGDTKQPGSVNRAVAESDLISLAPITTSGSSTPPSNVIAKFDLLSGDDFQLTNSCKFPSTCTSRNHQFFEMEMFPSRLHRSTHHGPNTIKELIQCGTVICLHSSNSRLHRVLGAIGDFTLNYRDQRGSYRNLKDQKCGFDRVKWSFDDKINTSPVKFEVLGTKNANKQSETRNHFCGSVSGGLPPPPWEAQPADNQSVGTQYSQPQGFQTMGNNNNQVMGMNMQQQTGSYMPQVNHQPVYTNQVPQQQFQGGMLPQQQTQPGQMAFMYNQQMAQQMAHNQMAQAYGYGGGSGGGYGYGNGYGQQQNALYMSQRMSGMSLRDESTVYKGPSMANASYVHVPSGKPQKAEDKLFGDLVDFSKVKPSKT
ncbi:hypothetical protein CTI12_AA302230 [Artemisia annua]|uniref:GAT domain-containing protein n=1 Tax=Artemisia annua TaxID=35608 RepID=A0A2U1N5E3_ARTAN|nr:hypothetical protein CTI12_AA302230 [Artemisia annua]